MKSGILTLNAGSSSVKLAVFSINGGRLCEPAIIKAELSGLDSEPALKVTLDGKDMRENYHSPGGVFDRGAAIEYLLNSIEELRTDIDILSVGHRIVHGGPRFSKPQILTDETIKYLQGLTPLAPKHQPANLQGVAVARKHWPGAEQVGCFDTAFHHTQPKVAAQFAIPRKIMADGVIRYGFHGISYEFIASAAPKVLGAMPHGRVIVAHLGAGASMCAIQHGKSIATTMGFSPLDGLPMGTRCGAIDPGVALYLLQEKNMSITDLADMLYSKSGLLGLSEISSDMRLLEASADPRAEEAVSYFVYRAVRGIGSLTAALGGLDALIFTAGIGEHSAHIRARIIAGLGWLGFQIDDRANAQNARSITKEGAVPSAWVIPTNEELMIARHTLRLLSPLQ